MSPTLPVPTMLYCLKAIFQCWSVICALLGEFSTMKENEQLAIQLCYSLHYVEDIIIESLRSQPWIYGFVIEMIVDAIFLRLPDRMSQIGQEWDQKHIFPVHRIQDNDPVHPAQNREAEVKIDPEDLQATPLDILKTISSSFVDRIRELVWAIEYFLVGFSRDICEAVLGRLAPILQHIQIVSFLIASKKKKKKKLIDFNYHYLFILMLNSFVEQGSKRIGSKI